MKKAVTMRKCKKDVVKKFTPQLSICETISKFNGVSQKGNIGQLEKLGLIKKKDSWTRRNGIAVSKVGNEETNKSKGWFKLEVIQGSSLK